MDEANQALINELAFEFWENGLLKQAAVKALVITELHNGHRCILSTKRGFAL